jgi:hypothetical protein
MTNSVTYKHETDEKDEMASFKLCLSRENKFEIRKGNDEKKKE